MPIVHLFSYPDTATEPLDFNQLLAKNSYAQDAPSEEKIKRLNDLRSRMARLLISQPNTKAILDVISSARICLINCFFQVIDEYVPELIEILPFIENNKLQNLMSKLYAHISKN